MSMRRIAVLQTGLLLVAGFANAASEKDTVRITVLDSVTRASAPDNNGVPQNCEQLTFDAYCRSTSNVPMVSTLLVQEDNEPPFRISCTIESRYSRCMPLPMGESFDARREKHGLVVYFVDEKGKERKQLYTLVDAGAVVVGVCQTLDEAMARANVDDFAVAVLDFSLGSDTASPLARRLVRRGVPFILHTGKSRREPSLAEWRDWPIVEKPAPSRVLVSALKTALSR